MSNMHGIYAEQVWDSEAVTLLVLRELPYDMFDCLVLRSSRLRTVSPGRVMRISGFLVQHDSTLVSGPDRDGPLPNS